MIKVVPFKKEHAHLIVPRPQYNEPSWDPRRLYRHEGRPAWTLFNGEAVGAIIGAIQCWPGMIEMWAVTSDEMEKAPIGFHKAALKILSAVETGMKPRRVQMTVKIDFEKAVRWANALGFEYEGRLKNYGPEGSDYFMYARTHKWPQD